MPCEISEEEKIMCYILVKELGLSLTEVGRRIGRGRKTVANYANQVPMGVSRTERERRRLKKKGLTIGENLEEQLGNRGFTGTTYQRFLLERRGVTRKELNEKFAKKRGYKSLHELIKSRFKEEGLRIIDVRKQLYAINARKPSNKELGRLITEFMKKEGLSLGEFSKLTKKTKNPISKMSLHNYRHGNEFPRVNKLGQLYDIMGIESNQILDPYLERESYENSSKLKKKQDNKLRRED